MRAEHNWLSYTISICFYFFSSNLLGFDGGYSEVKTAFATRTVFDSLDISLPHGPSPRIRKLDLWRAVTIRKFRSGNFQWVVVVFYARCQPRHTELDKNS